MKKEKENIVKEIIIANHSTENNGIYLVENGILVEQYQDRQEDRLEGNIYCGIVRNVLPGMQAAFVDIGVGKNTFMHIKDVLPKNNNETGNKHEVLSQYHIKDYIHAGSKVLVQVKRDETDRKGARVSTHISLAGRFVVLMPETEFVTVSQKIEKVEEKERLSAIVKEMLPEKIGAIIRTSANGKEKEAIQQDVQALLAQWQDIQTAFAQVEERKTQLLLENANMKNKLLTDVLDQNVDTVWVDNEEDYTFVKEKLEDYDLHNVTVTLQAYDLMEKYGIDKQLQDLQKRKIWLKCGGFITIDKTEALTAIDVNSGKYVGKNNLEQTIVTVNTEASIEIAKQIRLRDIGGIIIVDYIDMEKEDSRQKIIQVLEKYLKKDRTKTQIIGFTKLDLLELTRKHVCK